MHSPVSTPTPSQTPSKRIYAAQIPIDTNKVTEIWLDVANAVFIKIVAMNDLSVGSYASNTEYWYASTAVSIGSHTQLDFGSQSGSYGSTQISQFVGSLNLAFDWTQDIGTAGWTQGTYTPSASVARLYKATDPDDSELEIGLLIEQDEYQNLRGVTWYKQSNTGKAFDETPEQLTFTLVTKNGQPSTDPADIASGTWYYAHGGA